MQLDSVAKPARLTWSRVNKNVPSGRHDNLERSGQNARIVYDYHDLDSDKGVYPRMSKLPAPLLDFRTRV